MKIAHSERLLKAARQALDELFLWTDDAGGNLSGTYWELRGVIDEIDRDQRDGQP